LEKYQKSVRYIDVHFKEVNGEQKAAYIALLAPVLLNGALAALKLNTPAYARTAITLTDRALTIPGLSTADRAKGFYRRGLAYVATKDEDNAEADLTEAAALMPDDQAIKSELTKVKERRKAAKENEKKKFKKMFG